MEPGSMQARAEARGWRVQHQSADAVRGEKQNALGTEL